MVSTCVQVSQTVLVDIPMPREFAWQHTVVRTAIEVDARVVGDIFRDSNQISITAT